MLSRMQSPVTERPKLEQLELDGGTLAMLEVLTGENPFAWICSQPVSPVSPTLCRLRPVNAVCVLATGPLGVLNVLTAPTIPGPPGCPACAGFPSPGENAITHPGLSPPIEKQVK